MYSDWTLDKQVDFEDQRSDRKICEILGNDCAQQKADEQLHEQLLYKFLDSDDEILNEKLEILVHILPDASPKILKNFLKTNRNEESLQKFVESCLLKKDYEKRSDYYSKMDNDIEIKKYITHFNAAIFLKEFPDPFEFFQNSERQCIYQDQAYNFLKCKYSSCDEMLIKFLYNEHKYNLSLTDEALEFRGFISNSKINIVAHHIPLLQEIAFIQNKECIREYLKVIKMKEQKELMQLKEKKLIFECECCFDNEIKPNDFVECENNHISCKKCIIKGTNLAISNGQVSVMCFQNCKNEIPISILCKVLPKKTFDLFFKKRQEHEIMEAKIDDLVNCPFCSFSMVLDSCIQIFICRNRKCMKITCRLCKRENHLPIKCSDVFDEHRGRLFIEEEMSKQLIRYCYACNLPFIKESGCNKMTCLKCQSRMCYICKLPFGMGYHIKCLLHTNSDLYDKEQVELRKVQAITKLQNDFPDLKLSEM